MPLNWFLELTKWRNLILQFQSISMINSIRSILFGILLSVITPNRIGEVAGRLLHVKQENRIKAIHANIFSSISQLTVTISMGLVALYYLNLPLLENLSDIRWVYFLALILLLMVYFASNKLHFFVSKIAAKFKKATSIKNISTTQRVRTFSFSLLRYLVFTTQFILLSKVFGSLQSYSGLFSMVAAVYFFTAVLPTNWASGLIVRTSFTHAIFEVTVAEGAIGLSASIVLWMINLLLPASLGIVSLPKINWNVSKYLKAWS